ncbi:MAG: cysteine desulfuration protein SufE [Phycisphaera sp.]|nr:cysteine desulfuration protein SufE [Phycisphaera sp.]
MSDDTLTIDEIVENFEFLGDWEERFTYVLDLGKRLPEMDEDDMVEANRVHGCQATVYFKPTVIDADPPVIHFDATADAHIVSGLIAILLTMYNDRTAEQILAVEAEPLFEKMGLEEHLSPTRRNGLHAMIKRIRAIAAHVLAGDLPQQEATP